MGACVRFWRTRCSPCLRRLLGLPTVAVALCALSLLWATLVWYLGWPLLRVLPVLIALYALMSRWALANLTCLLVEHVYSLPLGKLHVMLSRRRNECPFHSRFVDFRVDVELEHGARASVHLIPLLSDNYAYLVVDASAPAPRPACIVDPSDAHAVLDALPAVAQVHYGGEEFDLQAIFTTHKHWDHQGGNRDLPRHLPSIGRVYGGKHDRILGCTHRVGHGDEIRVGALVWRVLALPGHTRGCVAYCLRGLAGRDCLMTGDALFCGGRCGAPFEQCDMEEHRNLLTLRRECGDETLLFPGHEYTCRCLGLSQQAMVEAFSRSARSSPGKLVAVASAWFAAVHRRAQRRPGERLPTVPISLGEERLLGSHVWDQLSSHAKAVTSLLEARAPYSPDAEEQEEGQEDSDDGSPEALTPTPVVLSHEHLPRANPVVALYRNDFDRICAQLESGELSGAAAAEALRAARERPEEELCGDPPPRVRTPVRIPKKQICQALRVLAVPPDVSIGREAPDLMGLTVCTDQLRASLQLLVGQAPSAAAVEVLDNLRVFGAPPNCSTVAELAEWLVELSPRPPRPPPGHRGLRRRRRRRTTVPPPPASSCCGCLSFCVRCLCAPCRAVGRLLCYRRRKVPVEELLSPPRHDVHSCALCSSTLFGARAEPLKLDQSTGAQENRVAQQPQRSAGHVVQRSLPAQGGASHAVSVRARVQGPTDMKAPLLLTSD